MNTEMHIISKLTEVYGMFQSLLLYSLNTFSTSDFWGCCSTSLNSFSYSLYEYTITLCCEIIVILSWFVEVSEPGMQTNMESLNQKSFIKQQQPTQYNLSNKHKVT